MFFCHISMHGPSWSPKLYEDVFYFIFSYFVNSQIFLLLYFYMHGPSWSPKLYEDVFFFFIFC
jgi:hypothetical protein